MRAAVGAKIWCLFVFCRSPSPAHCLFEQVFEQILRHSLWVNFDAVFNIYEK